MPIAIKAGSVTAVARGRPPLFARKPDWQFSLLLALEILFLFGAVPALDGGSPERDMTRMLQFCLTGTSVVLVVRALWLRVTLAATFVAILLATFLPGRLPGEISLGAFLTYNLLVTAAVARAVFGPGEVNHHRIAGAVFIYLNVALIFALAYAAVHLFAPDAFSGLPAGTRGLASRFLHFSFDTLTAIGGGQISANSALTRSLTDLETITGQLFATILFSRLVGLHLARDR